MRSEANLVFVSPFGRAEQRRALRRARSALRQLTSRRLSERSERSERSEFGAAAKTEQRKAALAREGRGGRGRFFASFLVDTSSRSGDLLTLRSKVMQIPKGVGCRDENPARPHAVNKILMRMQAQEAQGFDTSARTRPRSEREPGDRFRQHVVDAPSSDLASRRFLAVGVICDHRIHRRGVSRHSVVSGRPPQQGQSTSGSGLASQRPDAYQARAFHRGRVLRSKEVSRFLRLHGNLRRSFSRLPICCCPTAPKIYVASGPLPM
jgi:hypothetical protein